MLTGCSNIDALPEAYPLAAEDEDGLEEYQELRERLVRGSEVLEALEKKRAYYRHLLELARPFANPRETVQPNLVTKDGALGAELERTRVLAARLAVEVETAKKRGVIGAAAGESEEDDEVMWREKVGGLLG